MKPAVSIFDSDVIISSRILPFNPGSSKFTIALLVVGCVTLFAGTVNEAYTERSPIIPPRLFRVSSTVMYDAWTLMLFY